MNERFQAIELAHKLLDKPNVDPDDDLRVLSRQLIRQHERFAALQKWVAILESEHDRETIKRCIARRDAHSAGDNNEPEQL